jgi:hypothetical protein
VSFLGGAHDIADGSQITPDNAPHREYHHLFPVAYLRDNGIDERAASVALNCALITWRTNRAISAKPPSTISLSGHSLRPSAKARSEID